MTVKNKEFGQKQNCDDTSLIHKSDNAIIQKNLENTHFSFFKETKLGQEWHRINEIVKKLDSLHPDFIFETLTGKTVGLELTNLIVQSNKYYIDKHEATARLEEIGNKVCQYFKEEKGISLSLIIDIYDPRKWSPKWKDHIEACYDPGFRHINASNRDIKNAIIEALSEKPIPSFGIVKKWIDIGNQKFCITADRMYEPNTSVRVSNGGVCKDDPFEELQITINNKNAKYVTYKNNCDECDLLVVSDDGSTGNFANFTYKLETHKFTSLFRNVFLLDLGFNNIKVTKLITF